MDAGDGWFAAAEADERDHRLREGETETPTDWPARAVAEGFAADTAEYYDRLHEATLAATRAAVTERERADDQQLIHAVRAMDDAERTANELAERVAEWAGSLGLPDGGGVEGARAVTDHEPTGPTERRLVGLAERVVGLDAERAALRAEVERAAPTVAPNLAAMAGPVLAARLVALAGGLEALARMPSGTVQVLGAEDALFAHLRGEAPSPKHGVIYTHEAVRGTRRADRGSAARALAGKLTIAARVDHYAGDRRPALDRELADRLATIRARADDDQDGDGDVDGEGDR